MPGMPAHSNRLRYLAMTGLGLLLATLVFELYLRLVEATPVWRILPAAEASLYGPDPDTGYRLRPGVEGLWLTENRARLHISEQGLRDNPTSYAKPAGLFRIALAGDSVTEALQVAQEETFSERLEQAFVQDGRRVEVVNLGMSGAVPPVQVARMASLGVRFAPDLQVYMINVFDFLSPILADDLAFPGYVLGADGDYHLGHGFRDTPLYRFRSGRTGDLYYWLLDNLRVARVLNSRKNHGFGVNGSTRAEVSNPPVCDINRGQRLLAAIKGKSGGKGGRGLFQAFVRDVADISRASGAPALLAVRGLGGGCPEENGIRDQLRVELQQRLDAAGITMLDMDAAVAESLHKAGTGYGTREMYGFGSRIGQGHLNSFGHRIFAAALWDGLLARLTHGTEARRAALPIDEKRQP